MEFYQDKITECIAVTIQGAWAMPESTPPPHAAGNVTDPKIDCIRAVRSEPAIKAG